MENQLSVVKITFCFNEVAKYKKKEKENAVIRNHDKSKENQEISDQKVPSDAIK